MLSNSQDERGLTLLEVLVALGIFVLMIGAIISVMLVSFRSKDIIFEQLITQSEGRRAVQDFVNELRSASASSLGAYTLEQAGTDQVVFYSNIDKDSWRERVRYFLDGRIFKKGVTDPSGNPLSYNTSTEVVTDIVHDIANGTTSVFTYYDQNYAGASSTPLAQPVSVTAVRVVGIKLIMDEDPNLSPVPFNVEAKVGIRNLKNN